MTRDKFYRKWKPAFQSGKDLFTKELDELLLAWAEMLRKVRDHEEHGGDLPADENYSYYKGLIYVKERDK